MSEWKEERTSIAQHITELVNEIQVDIFERGKDLKQDEVLMKDIQKFERYDQISTLKISD
jgi:hypothetical protein